MKFFRHSLILLFAVFSFSTSTLCKTYVNDIKFQVYSLDNKEYTNKNFSDIVILHFGSLDSNIFIFDFLKLSSFAESKKYNFQYIPVFYSSRNDIEQFLSTYKVKTKIYIDKKDNLKNSIPLRLLPVAYVLDKNGSIIFEYIGPLDFDLIDKNFFSLDSFKKGGF